MKIFGFEIKKNFLIGFLITVILFTIIIALFYADYHDKGNSIFSRKRNFIFSKEGCMMKKVPGKIFESREKKIL
jgi:hypothetical protein